MKANSLLWIHGILNVLFTPIILKSFSSFLYRFWWNLGKDVFDSPIWNVWPTTVCSYITFNFNFRWVVYFLPILRSSRCKWSCSIRHKPLRSTMPVAGWRTFLPSVCHIICHLNVGTQLALLTMLYNYPDPWRWIPVFSPRLGSVIHRAEGGPRRGQKTCIHWLRVWVMILSFINKFILTNLTNKYKKVA